MMKRHLYPLFLDISGCRCLVVGAGRVGCRKIVGLLRAHAKEILVIDPNLPASHLPETLQPYLHNGKIHFLHRAFHAEDVQNCALVFAAGSDRQTHAAVAEACQRLHIFCNIADDPDACSFLVPACVETEHLAMAISTGGESPALAAFLKKKLEQDIDSRYDVLCRLLARLRPLVLAQNQNADMHGDLFRRIVQSPLADSLAKKDTAACQQILRNVLPPELHRYIMELLE